MVMCTEIARKDLDVEQANENENVEEKQRVLKKIKNFVLRQFLPIGTIFAIILGVFVPKPAVYLGEKVPLVKVCVAIILFSIGLRLRFHEAKSALTSYKEVVVGLILMLFIAPLFGTTVVNQIRQFGPLIGNGGNSILKNASNTSFGKIYLSNSSNEEVKMALLGPGEFRLGLLIYCLCPNSMATSLVMVTAANGHRGLCILISIISKVISVFTMPLMLVWLIPTLQHVHINVGIVLLNNVLIILLPLVIGRSLRCLTAVKSVIKKWDKAIKYTGLLFLITIILAKVSETSASGNLERLSIVNILCTVALGTSLTTFNLLASYGSFSILPLFSQESAVTLSISCSIPVVSMAAITVDLLPDNAGDKGLMTLPSMFVYLVKS